ncbi:MAG: toll/interleukin-1 receptor domain-containing protein [candidate division KSB1 bacterium]|nr:toll/interleukin-1 receptor domain-containing protein [candidate division KSB1 bacterium]MDZ7366988.1 toll/interleukin-1 receptor domain-containing protein [candidate division KSB1 bacterium]MDZ7406807.1 toll/interleukin-1 receptor domain-containing protein [candidate division KSB1 bacterium]
MAKKTSTAKSYLVFISHSSKDRWIAKQMANLIETRGRKHGVKAFLDEKDIEGGQSIPEEIKRNIKACDEFVVLLSQDSINRPWVLVETGGAWLLDKYIIVITHKVTPKEMPEVTAQYRAIDLNDFDHYLEQLLKRAKGVLK